MSGTQVFCILFYALPFIGIGVLGIYLLAEGLAGATLGPWDVAAHVAAILAFGGTGVFLFAAFISGDGDTNAERKSVPQGQPLLRNSQWSRGLIKGATRADVRGEWKLALVLNMLCAPLFVIGLREIGRNLWAAFGSLLIPAAGIALVFHAILTTLRLWRFGPSMFEMSPVPASPGGICSGTIQTRLRSRSRTSVHVVLKLTCVQQIWESRSQVQLDTLWSEVSVIPPGEISFGPKAASIPVFFALPPHVHQTTVIGSRTTGIRWLLQAEAEMAGVDLKEEFEVPVFHTEGDPLV